MLEVIDGRASAAPVHIPRPRPAARSAPEQTVREIVEDVRLRGDEALVELTERLDGARLRPEELRVDPAEVSSARRRIPSELAGALEVAAERLRRTCEQQLPREWTERGPDEFVGELIRPVRRVGIYAPGGRAAYPSSVIMAAVPARVAGVDSLAVATPPRPDGTVSDALLAACSVAGVEEVYRIGGAQAVAALAYGTATVRPVDKIVGPGNLFVTLAKRAVAGAVGVDSEAGPTELAVVADSSADPRVLALDLVAQAEHGPGGCHVLVTWDAGLAQRVQEELERAAAGARDPEEVENALIEGGRAVLVRDARHALDTVNAFAPEHLHLWFEGAEGMLAAVRSAGSVFVGPYSPVPVGDYVGGTNHVLPSGGTARWASGLGVNDFVKRIYVSGFGRGALERLGTHVESLARAEGLPAHGRAVRARLEPTFGGGCRS